LEVIFFLPERTNWLIVGILQKLLNIVRTQYGYICKTPLRKGVETKIYKKIKIMSRGFEKKLIKMSADWHGFSQILMEKWG